MPRLERREPKYDASQSPLFRVQSKRRLSEILQWEGTGNELDAFANQSGNYNVFTVRDRLGKARPIQHPKALLDRLHRRLASLLLRVRVPDYLHSGLRGRSYVTNGAQHVLQMPAIKLDVRGFYPSTKWGQVYRVFREDYDCSADVAGVLATLACYQRGDDRHLPTGSALSQILAFHVHRRLFDEIDAFARRRRGVYTLYVDDMVLSLPDASKRDIGRVGRLVNKHGLEWHKPAFFPKGSGKLITGTVARENRLEAPKRQHQRFATLLCSVKHVATVPSARAAASSAIGTLQSIAQVDARYRSRAAGAKNRFRDLLRARRAFVGV